MTEEEKKFMRTKGRGKSPRNKPPPKGDLFADYGRQGSQKRWGDHGPTKTVRAFPETVDRFRAYVPSERDRAAAATEALDDWLDGKGAPKLSRPQVENPVTLNAVLTYHWYDEIAAGRKRVEYRDINDYWTPRLWDGGMAERVRAIRFSRGYSNTRMTWEVREIRRNDSEGVYEIHLGKKIA